MGLCCCTLVSSPIGFFAGCGTACGVASSKPEVASNSRYWLYVSLAVFAIGLLLLYLPLSYLCSKANNTGWEFYPTYGPCWSEGNPQYEGLGILTGGFLGVGLGSAIIFLICHCRKRPEEESLIGDNNKEKNYGASV
mmetsp:Transcript_14340/g.16437  ORF Transcript_14340/g.16437 Transcript_14340/m.16437 type:complete len:137 (+) Transcript_14340:227-637(+)